MDEVSPLTFYPLSILQDEQGCMIGRPDTENYAYFPEDAVALLQLLQQGMPPNQAASWYEQKYGDTVDIDDFLMTLQDLKFICEEVEHNITTKMEYQAPLQWLGRVIFSPLAWVIYGTLLAISLLIMARFPALIPNSQDIFFSSSLVFIVLTILIFQIFAVFFHETYHALAGQRLGLPTKISVGHRLGALTLETSLTSLWTVPRRSRYLPLFAGMLADIVLFSICIIASWMTMGSAKAISPLSTFCLAMAYTTMLRFLWQFSFYLRTDLYYVIVTAFRCVDLQNTTRVYICNIFFAFFKRTDKIKDETEWYSRDRQVARWYMPIYLGGYGISIGFLLFVGLPLTIQLFSTTVSRLSHGISAHPDSFIDAIVFLTLNLAPWIVLTLSITNKLKKRAQRQPG